MSESIVLMQPKRWLRPADLEEEFDIKKETQAKMRQAGSIPFSKRGKFVYYDREKIDAWLEAAEMI